MRPVTEAPIEIRTTLDLSHILTTARTALRKHKTYEMAVEVQIAKRDLDIAVSVNRRIMRNVT